MRPCGGRAGGDPCAGGDQAVDRVGVKFDKEGTGRYELAREGGHSEHRILHHKDITGHEIERALMRKVKRHHNIEILEHHFARRYPHAAPSG
ncbi:MAG: hypothetical protein ACLR8Y_17885 [Alistipes indistinctus]